MSAWNALDFFEKPRILMALTCYVYAESTPFAFAGLISIPWGSVIWQRPTRTAIVNQHRSNNTVHTWEISLRAEVCANIKRYFPALSASGYWASTWSVDNRRTELSCMPELPRSPRGKWQKAKDAAPGIYSRPVSEPAFVSMLKH